MLSYYASLRSVFHVVISAQKTLFGSSLHPVVCRSSCLIDVICVYVGRVVYNTCGSVFLVCLSSCMIPLSLDCPCLIVPEVFSNVHFIM